MKIKIFRKPKWSKISIHEPKRLVRGPLKTQKSYVVDSITPGLSPYVDDNQKMYKSFMRHKKYKPPSDKRAYAKWPRDQVLWGHIHRVEKNTRWLRCCRVLILEVLAGRRMTGTVSPMDHARLAAFAHKDPRPERFRGSLTRHDPESKRLSWQPNDRRAGFALAAEAIKIQLSMEKMHRNSIDLRTHYTRILRSFYTYLPAGEKRKWLKDHERALPALPDQKLDFEWEMPPSWRLDPFGFGTSHGPLAFPQGEDEDGPFSLRLKMAVEARKERKSELSRRKSTRDGILGKETLTKIHG